MRQRVVQLETSSHVDMSVRRQMKLMVLSTHTERSLVFLNCTSGPLPSFEQGLSITSAKTSLHCHNATVVATADLKVHE